MKLVNRGLALLLAAALAIPSLPVNAASVSDNNPVLVSETDTFVSQKNEDETKNPAPDSEKQDELTQQENADGEQDSEKESEEELKEKEEGIKEPEEDSVSQNDEDETKNPAPDSEKQDELTQQENADVEQDSEKESEEELKEKEEGIKEPEEDSISQNDADGTKNPAPDSEKQNELTQQENVDGEQKSEEVKVNTGNFEFTVADTSVSANAIGDTYFDQDGNYTINIPEANPFFPYEVQFKCDGEVTTEWFMTPDDSVEIGGHTFYVSAYMDGTVVTQMSLNVAGKTVIVYPERKEFTNDGMGAMPASLLPLTTVELADVDLTGFTPAELTQVSVTSIMGNNIAGAQNLIWRYEGTDGDYMISSSGDKIDLSYQTNYGGTNWEMIVGNPDQLDEDNIRYKVYINVTDSDQWLSPQVYVQNADGTKSQASENGSYYYDYSREYRNFNVYAKSSTSVNYSSKITLKLGINESVYSSPKYASFKIFEGDYSNASETAGAIDITSQICSDIGYNVSNWSYNWLTMVTYDASGNVTGCLPFELYISVSGSTSSDTPTTSSYISTGVLYMKDDAGNLQRASDYGDYDSSFGGYEYNLYKDNPVNGTYYWKLNYIVNGTADNDRVTAAYVGEFNSIAEAKAAGAMEVKSTLFGSEGYAADYSQGIAFSIFIGNDGETKRKVFHEGAKAVIVLNSGRTVTFNGLKNADGSDVPYYVVETYKDPFYGYSTGEYNDSYGEYNFITMLVDPSVDLSQPLAPEFWVSEGAKLYTAGSSTEEISGVSTHLFNEGAIQYTCSAEDGENSRNYWLQILTAEEEGKLYINSLEDEVSNTKEENGIIYSTREMMLDGYHDYVHDILLVNKGMVFIPGLSAELESDVVALDEYWTLKGTHELKGFQEITGSYGRDELSNQAKIRIKAKEGVTATEVSGTLTIKSNGNTLMVLNLTGTLGDPTIITKDIPEAVKYVPYGTMIQNNNKYSWNKVSYSLSKGKLPRGMVIKPNGEIYGVPQETGRFTFTVRMENSSDEFESCTKEFTLNVIENTDTNVDNATDTGYDLTQRVQNIYWDGSVSGEQTMVSEGIFGEFVDIYLDGQKLVKGTDYTAESGSTRITIMNQTLAKSGSAGTHTLGIEFRTQDDANVLKRAAQNYVVTAKESGSGNTDNGSGSESNNDSNYENDFNFDYESETGSNTPNSFNQLAAQLKENAEKNKANANNAVAVTESVSYTIQPGDTLWKLAVKYFGDGNQWRKILEDNKATVTDPNKIYAGQVIIINVTANGTETVGASGTTSVAAVTNDAEIVDGIYTVKAGDTMWKISKKVYGTGIFWRRIFNANKETIKDASRIYVGQTIKIP